MASYQARQRDPLFDSRTQVLIERRGKELLGFAFLVVAILLGMILWSYNPDDPSWLAVTDQQAQNLLGRFGASIASPMIVIAGMGAWAISAVLAVWGVRFITHIGEERAVARMIFAPIGIALASVYASTLVPGAAWTHSFGLGGLFGDTVLGAVLGVLPVKAALGLKVMSLAMAGGMLVMAAFILGADRGELMRFGRFLLLGVVLIYAAVARLLGLGATGTVMGARGLLARQSSRRRARQEARRQIRQARQAGTRIRAADAAEAAPAPGPLNEPRIAQPAQRHDGRGAAILRADPAMAPHAGPTGETPAPAPRPGILSRLPGLRRRNEEPAAEPQPELFGAEDLGNPEIKAKIAQIIKNRVMQQTLQHGSSHGRGQGQGHGFGRGEPPLRARHPRGPQPIILEEALNNRPATGTPAPAVDGDLGLPLEPSDSVPPAPAPSAVAPKPVVRHPPRKTVKPSRKAKAEAQPALPFDTRENAYELPPLNLLSSPDASMRYQLSDEALEQNARMLESVLDDYGVKGQIVSVRPGPVVTMYELEPAPGLKASRVIGLSDDIARSMSALSARVSTVPGRSVIGIELPNEHREKVMLREILAAREFGDSHMTLPLALGKDIGGDPVVASLAKMPHLLIAGTTGSGKSVAINTMILSLLYQLSPEECRLIMIDPKMLELSVYDGIPHLLSPVVTDPKKAVVALKWVVAEMEERYRKMSKMGVRNIEGYNGRVADALARGEMFSRTVQTGFDDETGDPVFETEEIQPEKLPYIVVIVDEMADLMMVAGKEIEACIQRLAQMARASGIHLIMATQRPSVDVITGTIKANFPTRISFQVTSKVDSRTILGEQGAEQLLGMGDMLYMAGGARITRVHGPFVSDEEVEEVVNSLKAYGPPQYVGGVVEGPDEDKENDIDLVLGLGGNTTGEDALYDQAVAIVARDRKCSTSYIQRKLAIGYNKAARLVEQMEENRLVSPANHVGKREILMPEQQ